MQNFEIIEVFDKFSCYFFFIFFNKTNKIFFNYRFQHPNYKFNNYEKNVSFIKHVSIFRKLFGSVSFFFDSWQLLSKIFEK